MRGAAAPTTAGTVAILGGGVGGMTAAHELAERGFHVVVYERGLVPGGKARSVPVPALGARPGCRELPGEHGFRFFPGFYRHLPDTMAKIPVPGQPGSVLGNLVPTTQVAFTRPGRSPILLPDRFPESVRDLQAALRALQHYRICGTPTEMAYLWTRLLTLLTSCHERRHGQWEYVDWWTFSGASSRSSGYQFLNDSLTRMMVAAHAQEMSTRTAGLVFLQMIFDLITPSRAMDRVLNGPTNDAWITPWLQRLHQLGVSYRMGANVERMHCTGSRLTGIRVCEGGASTEVDADFYVAAFPVDVMARMATEPMMAGEPKLADLSRLRTRWMNGMQFYLDRDISAAHGHAIHRDTPFALTSVSQQQFWPDFPLRHMGDGRVSGIISVDISDWEAPGVVYGRPASELTVEQVKDEVWAQLKMSLPDLLHEENLVGWFLGPGMSVEAGRIVNAEPLLINTAGSWDLRPDAVTGIENLFLAADYVRTFTDLATMESANEAARRAVNGVLDAAGSREERCQVWPLSEPAIFGPLRELDRRRYRRGLPHVGARQAESQLPGQSALLPPTSARDRGDGDVGAGRAPTSWLDRPGA